MGRASPNYGVLERFPTMGFQKPVSLTKYNNYLGFLETTSKPDGIISSNETKHNGKETRLLK